MVRVELDAPRGVRRPRRRPQGGVGQPLVVADRQRRAPGDERARGDVRSHRVLHLRRLRPRRARRAPEGLVRQIDVPLGRSSTRRGSRPEAASSPISPSCGSGTSSSASSRAAHTGWPTASGSSTTCRRTAPPRSPTSRAPGRPSACGGRAHGTSWARSRATTSRTRASRSRPVAGSSSGPLRALASRISYVGDLGWELYVPIEQGRACGISSGKPGSRTASCPRVSACTGRPGGSRSATARMAPSSRASTPRSRPGWPVRA